MAWAPLFFDWTEDAVNCRGDASSSVLANFFSVGYARNIFEFTSLFDVVFLGYSNRTNRTLFAHGLCCFEALLLG